MRRLQPYPVSAFLLVTLFIWGNRVWLAWTNAEDSVARKLAWSVPITVFVTASVAGLAALLLGRWAAGGPWPAVVRALALVTVVFWAVRAPMILAADHPGPFKVVHTVLAVASVSAAVVALRALRRERETSRPRSASAPPVEGREEPAHSTP